MAEQRPVASLITASLAVILTFGIYVGGYRARTLAEVGSSSARVTAPNALASTEPGGSISESAYFYEVAELLRQNYVEEIQIDQKMASGSVRGMVGSLLDPDSRFFDADELAAFKKSLNGEYEGIGIETRLLVDQDELQKFRSKASGADALYVLPELQVTYVAPGSPAEKGGLKAGDVIDTIDDKWIISGKDVRKLRELQRLSDEGKVPASEFNEFRNQFDQRTKATVTATRARKDLSTSGTEPVSVGWRRGDQRLSATIARVKTTVDDDGRLLFRPGKSEDIVRSLKSGDTIDLRSSGRGDLTVAADVLSKLLPVGQYGAVTSARNTAGRPLKAEGGKEISGLTIYVDEWTRGAPAIFARAMADAGLATLNGTLSDDALAWTDLNELPTGEGYLLSVGNYVSTSPVGAVKAEAGR